MSSSVAPASTARTLGPCEQGQDLPSAHTFSHRPCCHEVATCVFVPARGREPGRSEPGGTHPEKLRAPGPVAGARGGPGRPARQNHSEERREAPLHLAGVEGLPSPQRETRLLSGWTASGPSPPQLQALCKGSHVTSPGPALPPSYFHSSLLCVASSLLVS